MDKRIITVSLICLMTLTLVIAGLVISKPSTAKVINLRLAHHMSEKSHATVQGITPWVKAVEAATKGQVKITQYPGGTLVKGRDGWEGVRRGTADMALVVGGFFPGMFTATDVVSLPVLPFSSAKAAGGVMWKLHEKFPEISKEFKDIKPLVFVMSGPYHLMTTAKAGKVQDAADWKGMKIRALGGPQTDFMKSLGAVPTTVTSSEIYTALERGIIDGAIYLDHGLQAWKLGEVVRYLNTQPISFGHGSISMNLKTWNNLPKDIQNQIMSVSGLKGSEDLNTRWYDAFDREAELAKFAKEGYKTEIYQLTPAQRAEWRALSGKVWQTWLDKVSRMGVDGQKIIDAALQFAKEYE